MSLFVRVKKVSIGIPLLLAMGCGRNSQRVMEQPIPAQKSATAAVQTTAPVVMTPPTAQELQQVMERVTGDVVALAQRQGSPVLTGDFNGDSYPDLVVAVKPIPAKLEEINSELANWSVENPHHSYVPPKNKSVVVPPPIQKPERVRAGETLLLVVHGYGPAGWRDPLASQTYLLREVAGRFLQVSKPSVTLTKDFGEFSSPRNVIAENLGRTRGVIYWTGAAYAWHVER